MTSPEPMTREELLELAALDAFALLDDYESALFTRSFHHAPAAVQDEIQEIQAAFASEAALLPDAEPTPDLRQQVLDAVAKAVESEAVGFSPLAMIGRTRPAEKETAGRIGLGSSAQIWRAAAFVLAGVVLVSAYFNVQLRSDNNQLIDYAFGLGSQKEIEKRIGTEVLAALGSPTTTHVALLPTASSMHAERGMFAMLGVPEGGDEAVLFLFNLPARSEFTLTARDADDNVVFSVPFKSGGLYSGVRIDGFPASLAANVNVKWEITGARDEGRDPLVLTSRVA